MISPPLSVLVLSGRLCISRNWAGCDLGAGKMHLRRRELGFRIPRCFASAAGKGSCSTFLHNMKETSYRT